MDLNRYIEKVKNFAITKRISQRQSKPHSDFMRPPSSIARLTGSLSIVDEVFELV